MRFKWRSHLAVTALAAFSLLPLAGCSSQQQQGDEVMAEQGEGGDEQVQEDVGTDAVNQEVSADNGSNEAGTQDSSMGEDVVSNDAGNPNAAADGDLQEIINEMGGNGSAQANAEVPMDNAAVAMEAPANVPVESAEAAPAESAVAVEESVAPADAGQPAMAPVAGLPELGSKMAYVIEAGDTLGKVATRIYGDQKRWRDISSLTGLADPNHIFPGDVVYYSLDEVSAQFASTYESMKRSREVVREGDTLASIAQRVYGSGRSWRHIWRQNDHIDNPDKLTAGMSIYYVEKDAIKTAFNKFLNKSKLTQEAKAAVKTIQKTSNIISVLNYMNHCSAASAAMCV